MPEALAAGQCLFKERMQHRLLKRQRRLAARMPLNRRRLYTYICMYVIYIHIYYIYCVCIYIYCVYIIYIVMPLYGRLQRDLLLLFLFVCHLILLALRVFTANLKKGKKRKIKKRQKRRKEKPGSASCIREVEQAAASNESRR